MLITIEVKPVIKYANDCVGCPPEIGCLGSSCPQRNVLHTYCDRCGDEARLFYSFDDEQLCEDCLSAEIDEWWGSLTMTERREICAKECDFIKEVEI